MPQSVLAIAAHPDDIEFSMAGTLMLLQEQGWEVHYFNVANGCCGSTELSREQCAEVRLSEAKQAAKLLSAVFHPPICNDLEIFYDSETLQKVAATLRSASPQIVLTHALVDYMEDHQNTARLAASAAFTRGMPNFETSPAMPICPSDIAVYHAQPHGNKTPLKQKVTPEFCIEVTGLQARKRELLACHESQNTWLDVSQGMNSYLDSMASMNAEVGRLSKQFEFAEGWTQHLHLGLASTAEFNPLAEALASYTAFV